MKKPLSITCLLIIFLATTTAARKHDSPFADSLLHLVSIANEGANFGGIIGDTAGTDRDGLVYKAIPVLGADGASGHPYFGSYLRLELFYAATNPAARNAESAIEGMFSTLVKNGQAREYRASYLYHALTVGGRTILTYRHNSDNSTSINIYPSPKVLAEEAAYGGKFRATPAPGLAPQITEHPCKPCGDGAVERDNGIFDNGGLLTGSKTIRGSNSYYNGYWYCDAWQGLFRGSGDAYVFIVPASSPGDTIYGHLYKSSMSKFYPDVQYAASEEHVYKRGVFQIKKHAPEWLMTSYYQQEVRLDKSATAADAAYAREHPNETYKGGTFQNSGATTTKSDRWASCSCCGGKGYTETYNSNYSYVYKSKSGAETTTSMVRSTCTCCHGTGR